MANIKIPYALIPAVAVDKRREHVVAAIQRKLPPLTRQPVNDTPWMYVACYGPSLRDTWQELRGKKPILAMSGATKFLAERGIIADYALEMDPRPSKLMGSLPPVPGVTYVVASCVVPEYLDQLQQAGNPILLWHTVNTNWDDESKFVAQFDPDALVVHGGSTAGITALHIGGILGFTRFEIHGMDGSFGSDGVRHAGFHGGKAQAPAITWDAGGRTYRTSKIMANAVAESINTAKNFPIITLWHGDGLTQALIREGNLRNAACIDQAEKVNKLRGLRPQVVQMPPMALQGGGLATFWDTLLNHLIPSDLPELVQNIAICEPRRAKARYNTGTIPFEAAVYLRGLSRFYQPQVIAEVGTFIGTSTLALKPGRVIYTCDSSNDCVPAVLSNDEPNIVTHPFCSSTLMLQNIQEKVDLFFFDGRIQADDIPLITQLSHPGTVYVFDDFTGREKGVINVEVLAPHLMQHLLVTPTPKKPSTLAAIVPFQRTGTA